MDMAVMGAIIGGALGALFAFWAGWRRGFVIGYRKGAKHANELRHIGEPSTVENVP